MPNDDASPTLAAVLIDSDRLRVETKELHARLAATVAESRRLRDRLSVGPTEAAW